MDICIEAPTIISLVNLQLRCASPLSLKELYTNIRASFATDEVQRMTYPDFLTFVGDYCDEFAFEGELGELGIDTNYLLRKSE